MQHFSKRSDYACADSASRFGQQLVELIWFRLSHSGYGRIVCINRAPSVGNTAQAANKKKRDGIMVTFLRLIRNLGSQLLLDSWVRSIVAELCSSHT